MTKTKIELNALEKSLALVTTSEGLWQCMADPAYEANNGMFGGWTAAILLKAVVDDSRSTGTASACTVNYVRRVTPGSSLCIKTRIIGGGRAFTHWQAELCNADASQIFATASIVMSDRQTSKPFTEFQMPTVAMPRDLASFSPPGAFGQQVEIMTLEGFPPVNQPNTRSIGWVKERSARPLDPIQLTFLSDIYPPRIWYTLKKPCPMATVTLSVYFLATQEELSANADSYVLTEAIGSRGESSTYGSQARMWSENGTLLATTEQLAWYRD